MKDAATPAPARQFAKLFNDTLHGQILVKLDTGPDADGPEVRFFYQPPGLGVCSLALGFSDTDAGWDEAEAAFEKVDEQKATDIVAKLIADWGDMTGLNGGVS